jgi:hypothetical protein
MKHAAGALIVLPQFPEACLHFRWAVSSPANNVPWFQPHSPEWEKVKGKHETWQSHRSPIQHNNIGILSKASFSRGMKKACAMFLDKSVPQQVFTFSTDGESGCRLLGSIGKSPMPLLTISDMNRHFMQCTVPFKLAQHSCIRTDAKWVARIVW